MAILDFSRKQKTVNILETVTETCTEYHGWALQMIMCFLVCYPLIMSTPLGGGHIIFAFSAVRRPTWFPDILGNSSYPIFTKFGMQVYWVNSLYGIAFGDDSSIAN